MMQFYNATSKILQVKDGGGEVVVGPYLPGDAEKGPMYPIHVLPDHYREKWEKAGKIVVVE